MMIALHIVYTGVTLMWNPVYIQKDVPDTLIAELIEHSAEEVVKKLPKKKQEESLFKYYPSFYRFAEIPKIN